MEEKNEKYLPIGSVCLLEGGQRYIVVIGYLGMEQNGQNEIYDYMGAVFPVGVISSDVTFMFNHNQISKVIFKGYENEESKQFNQKLNELPKEEILKNMQKGNSQPNTSNQTVSDETGATKNNEVLTNQTTTTPFGGVQ